MNNLTKTTLITALALFTGVLSATENKEKIGREFYNAPINFHFPYLGNVGYCYLQTHTNGWTQFNIDSWRCDPQSSFTNGTAYVVSRDGVDKWTILQPDIPLYKFGRFYCGFIREDRSNGDHAIFAALFYNGELIGGEYLRAGFNWQEHTWKEYDAIPTEIKQLGGGDWEVGVLVVSDPTHPAKAYTVDIEQMILKSDIHYCLSKTLRERINHAKFTDIKDIYSDVKRLTRRFNEEIPVLTNADTLQIANCENSLSRQFVELIKYWKIVHAKTCNEKHKVLSQYRNVKEIGRDVFELHYPRGSHTWPDFGEDLIDQLLEAWMLDEHDAKLWEAVSDMQGKIGKYDLRFAGGIARSEKEDRDGQPMFKVFKVQCDFYKDGEYVYAKVIGDDADFCYMPSTYTIPAWVVKVNSHGKIVKTYPYPQKVSSLRALLGKDK